MDPQSKQQVLVQLWAEMLDKLESKDVRKIWDSIVRELGNKFGTNWPVDKIKAKVKYLMIRSIKEPKTGISNSPWTQIACLISVLNSKSKILELLFIVNF